MLKIVDTKIKVRKIIIDDIENQENMNKLVDKQVNRGYNYSGTYFENEQAQKEGILTIEFIKEIK